MDIFEIERQEYQKEAENAVEKRRQERLFCYAEKMGITVGERKKEDA